MARSRSIAVAQTCPVKGDMQANLDELALAAGLAFSEGDPRLSHRRANPGGSLVSRLPF